jgi:hypothetical protein
MVLLSSGLARGEGSPAFVTDTTGNYEQRPAMQEDEEAEPNGLLGPIRIGPLVGVGLPNLLNAEILMKVTRYFAAGVGVGVVPTLHIAYYGDATIALQNYEVFARVHPLGGGWFLGAGLGYSSIRGTFSSQFDTTPYVSQIPPGISVPASLLYESRGSIRTMTLTPQIGYLHVSQVGFAIGADVGVALPVAPSRIEYDGNLNLPPNTPLPVVDAVRQQLLEPNNLKVEDTLQRIGRSPVPTINIRVGWML